MAGCKVGSQCYIDSKGINLEDKTVSVVLSDESKVLRFSWEDGMYDLILEHSEEAVDLTRKDIMPVLLQHDTYQLPLGIWQNIRVEDGKLKGTAKFDSEDAKAMEVFGKISRGFMQTFSVGVTIKDKVLDSEKEGKKTYKATRWEITECSVVTIPAIPNARVGLAAMPDNTKIVNSHKGTNMELSQENFNTLLVEREELNLKVSTLEAENVQFNALKAEMDTKLSEAVVKQDELKSQVDTLTVSLSESLPKQEITTRMQEALTVGVGMEVALKMMHAGSPMEASLIALQHKQSSGGTNQEQAPEKASAEEELQARCAKLGITLFQR